MVTLSTPDSADWLRHFTTKADPAAFTAAFTSGALSVLREAGLPATVKKLRAIEEVCEGERLTSQTAAARIEADRNLPEQVRLAPDVIYRAAQVRHWLGKNHARNAVTETARLYAVVIRSMDIDAEPYIKAGAKALAQRQKIAAKKKQAADNRAKLLQPVWAGVEASMPDATDFQRCMEAAAILHQQHPDVWAKAPGEQTIRDLLDRSASGT